MTDAKLRATCAALLLIAGVAMGTTLAPRAAEAGHVAAHTCGVTSGTFARTCRPGAHKSCTGAVTRGVKGFTTARCEQQRSACSTCLAEIRACIAKIGHGSKATYSCAACREAFDRCYAKRYPKS